MTGLKALILRITGIVFFMLTLSVSLIMIGRTVESFAFFVTSEDLGWGLFYVFTSFIFVTFFLFSLFSTGTSAIFAGSGGYVQSVWNCGIYSLVCVSLFTGLQFITGVTEGDVQIVTASEISIFILFYSNGINWFCCIFILLLYNLIIFLCFRTEKDFMWKNIIPRDSNTKLCIKVYGLMILIIETGCFLYAHKLIDAGL